MAAAVRRDGRRQYKRRGTRIMYKFSALTKTCGVLALIAWLITDSDWLVVIGAFFLVGAWYILDFYYRQYWQPMERPAPPEKKEGAE